MSAQENVLPIEGSSRVIGRGDRRIGSILAEEGKLGSGDIERVMALQHTEGLRFGDAALRLALITADDLHHAIAKQYDLPHLLAGHESTGSELVVAQEPFHPRAEEMRALRTQLLIRWAKAGRIRHLGRRPQVRGKAMNPKDHPHGGGEGLSSIGLKHPKTPTGKPALGYRTRRNKRTQKFIVRRRDA